MFLSLGIAKVFVVGVVISSSFAEADERLVFTAGGPTQSILEVCFSADSSQVYSAGLDKRVFRWDLFRDPNDDGRLVQVSQVDSLWWPVSRGNRGSINCIAISANQPDLVAIGGTSTFGSYGDICLIDAAGGVTTDVLPAARVANSGDGHVSSVRDLAASADGDEIISVSEDGEARYWQRSKGWRGKVLIPRSDTTSIGAFLCTMRQDGAAMFTREFSKVDKNRKTLRWGQIVRVANPDADVPQSQLLDVKHGGRVLALAADSGSGNWVSSDLVGRLNFWNGDQLIESKLLEPKDGESKSVVTSAMFGRSSLLLLNTASIVRATQENRTRLEIWDVENRKVLDSVIVATGRRPGLTAAISPDEQLAAGVDDDHNAIVLFEIDDRGLFRRDGVDIRRTRVQASTDPPKAVKFLKDKDPQKTVLRIEARSGVSRILDFSSALLRDPPKPDLRPAVNPAALDGRRLNLRGRLKELPDGSIVREIEVAGGGVILLDRYTDVSVHVWLPVTANGAQIMALGSSSGEILVYRFGGKNRPWELARYFRDHTDAIISLTASSEGRFLTSASADGTVKVWSVEGLNRPDTPKHHSRWGVAFKLQDGAMRVSQVELAGIGHARGLREGDVVSAIESSQGKLVTAPKLMLTLIESGNHRDQIRFFVHRNGAGPQIGLPNIVAGWEPLVTVFFDRQNEWAMATPRGFYDASANGDDLFGWVVNPAERSESPEFHDGPKFREKYERPDVVRKLLSETRNLPDALDRAGVKPSKGIAATAKEFPRVEILSPRESVAVARKADVTIKARMTLPLGRAKYTIGTWLNGAPLPAPNQAVNTKDNIWEMEWNTTAFNSRNRVRVQARALHEGPDHNAVYDDAVAHFQANVARPETRVFLVGIGVGQAYPVAKLRFTVDDVREFSRALADRNKRLFKMGAMKKNPILLLDHEVTKQGVAQLIANLLIELKANARPQDLLVVCLAGHGQRIGSEFYFLTPFEGLGTANLKVRAQKSIPWSMLNRLSEAPCRKVFLIDACHSGQAVIQSDAKLAVRSANAANSLVIAAAGPSQSSYEHNLFGHGYFTHCWLDALKGHADGFHPDGVGAGARKNGEVDLLEAVRFVEAEVPARVKRIGEDGFQNPTYSPRRLAEFWDIPLSRPNVVAVPKPAAVPQPADK